MVTLHGEHLKKYHDQPGDTLGSKRGEEPKRRTTAHPDITGICSGPEPEPREKGGDIYGNPNLGQKPHNRGTAA